MLELLLTSTLTLNLDTLVVLVEQLEASKAEMKRWKGEEGVSAAQPIDVHDVQPQHESQMVDEHDPIWTQHGGPNIFEHFNHDYC